MPLIVLLLVAAIATSRVEARIIRRHDVPDSAYVARGRSFPAVGAIGRLGDATLIAPRWAITAAHVARGAMRRLASPSVRIEGVEYAIEEAVLHPRWTEMGPHDVALVRLARPVSGVAPLAPYAAADERGRVATLVGHGATGAGNDRARRDDGLRRASTSAVDSVDALALHFSFTAPPGGTPLEGAPGAGDSGGPALLEVGGRWFVAGISSAGYDGVLGPGTYGAVDVFTRVSTHRAWIEGVVSGRESGVRLAPGAAPSEPAPRDQGTAAPTDTGSAALPDTPIGRRAEAFVRAMRQGTDVAILGFLREHFAEAELAARPAEARLPNFRRLAEQLRGVRLARVRDTSPTAITMELAREGGPPMVLELVAEERAPHKLVDWRRFD